MRKRQQLSQKQAFRRLAASILKRACKEAQSTNGVAASAREWLSCEGDDGDLAEFLFTALDIDHARARQWVLSLERD